MKKYIYSLILFTVTGLMFSCDDEDFTGDSTLTPSSPSIAVTVPNAAAFVEQDTTFTFTVELSEPQVVDVAVYIFQSGGTATAGSDFTFTNRVVIPAYRTEASGTIEILTDDENEETEGFELTVGDHRTANASITPVTTSFTILNSREDVLESTLSWSTNALEVIGLELDPQEVADYRMLILNASDSSIVTVIDPGATYEAYHGYDSLPDGDYLIATDLYATIDAGDLNAPITVSFQLEFYQYGVQSTTLSFSDVTENTSSCSGKRIYLATVTKAGTTYTIGESVGVDISYSEATSIGTFSGVDTRLDGLPWNGSSQVSVSSNAGQLVIDGLNVEFMEVIWGEEIQTSVAVNMNIDLEALTIDIPEQYIFTTLYNGTLYDYNIVGTGTIDDICTGAMTLEYEMIQDGFEVGAWLNANGYSSDEIFTAILTK